MKRTLLSLLALSAVFFFGAMWAVAQEAETPAEAPAEKAPVVKAETITGTISIVVAEKGIIIVDGAGGVPYSFKVNRATRIKVAGQKAKLADLEGQAGKSASVKFLPLRTGNLAKTIEVQ